MKLAIMQPYFIPYLGYFQMMNAVDEFMLYDDVNFIKRGWVHRNKTTINGKENYLGLSLSKASQNKKINEIDLNVDSKWRNELMEKIRHRYSKCPNYKEIEPLVAGWLYNGSSHRKMSDLLCDSLIDIADYLEIDSRISVSSKTTTNQDKKGSDRILDICLQRGADTYINAINGRNLYDKEEFSKNGVSLFFIQMTNNSYASILDWLMEKDKLEIQEALNDYELL